MESDAGRELFNVLKRIGKHLLNNRATGLETLTYLTYLCYRGAHRGKIEAHPEAALSEALTTVETLSQFTFGEAIGDDLHELDELFANPQLQRKDCIHAIHMVLTVKNDCIPIREEGDRHFFVGEAYSDSYSSLLRVLESLPAGQKRRVLDLCPRFIPFFYSFDSFQHYVMLERNNIRRAYFVLRKELEGTAWSNVEILSDYPKDESFDCILAYSDFSVKNSRHTHSRHLFQYINDALRIVRLEDTSVLLLTVMTDKILDHSFQTLLQRLNGFYLDRVIRLATLFYMVYPVLILKKEPAEESSVTFVSLLPAENKGDRASMEDISAALQMKEGAYATTVPISEIRKGTLSPDFYLMRRDILKQNGYLSLSDISLNEGIGRWDKSTFSFDDMALTVRPFENDSRLVALMPDKERAVFLNFGSILTKSAILLYSATHSERTSNHVCAARIDVDAGLRIHIPSFMIPVVIDQERFDSRFVLMSVLHQVPLFNKISWAYYFHENSPAILDLIRIPDIPIEEQRKAVEEYLQGQSKELPRIARKDSGPVPYNILVITPDRDTFEDRYGGKMEEEHLNVVGYASDSKSLSEVLPKHFGKDVPASQRVDAVLADVSAPVGDTNFILMKIHDLDVRKFYYSTCGYSRGCIYDIFWDAVESGLVEGDEPASGMRRALDTQMSPEAKLREEYREFFRSADRLDTLHPGWDLSGTVMKYLLDGRTKTPVNTVRSRLSETLCRFFRDCRAVPFCMEDGAIPSFLADGDYKDGKRNLEYKVDDKVDEKTQKSEAWVRYAFVALFKLGNKESHVSKDTEEMVSEAALIILMQVIRWFEGAHDRYAEGGVGFKCFRGDKECRLQTVREVAPGYFAVGDVHVGRQEGLRDGSVGVLNDHLPREKNPRTIDGATYTRYAGKDSFHILLQ